MIHTLCVGHDLLKDGHLLPSLFVLLPNKTEAIYSKIWEEIQFICPQADPAEMLMDYEKAGTNASLILCWHF